MTHLNPESVFVSSNKIGNNTVAVSDPIIYNEPTVRFLVAFFNLISNEFDTARVFRRAPLEKDRVLSVFGDEK